MNINVNDIYKLTPVAEAGGMYFKRDDLFAPFGTGGVNGSKLRQLIYLVENQVSRNGIKKMISGAVSGSPQHPMAAIVAREFGLDYTSVTGAKNIKGKPMLEMAEKYGAKFIYSNCGYAKSLEAQAFKHDDAETYVLETNIVVNNARNKQSAAIEFHSIGGRQVTNIPKGIERLIIPTGSATSAISILFGLSLYGKPTSLKEIVFMGIGNIGSRDLDFIFRRLEFMGIPKMGIRMDFNFTHLNLNGDGYCKYEDLFPFSFGGIDFHPRYEGKCMRYLTERRPELMNEKSLFWIVGSEPKF